MGRGGEAWVGGGEGGKRGRKREESETRIRIKTSKRKKAVVGEDRSQILKKAESSLNHYYSTWFCLAAPSLCDTLTYSCRSHIQYCIFFQQSLTLDSPFPITQAPFSHLSVLRPRLSPPGWNKGTC